MDELFAFIGIWSVSPNCQQSESESIKNFQEMLYRFLRSFPIDEKEESPQRFPFCGNKKEPFFYDFDTSYDEIFSFSTPVFVYPIKTEKNCLKEANSTQEKVDKDEIHPKERHCEKNYPLLIPQNFLNHVESAFSPKNPEWRFPFDRKPEAPLTKGKDKPPLEEILQEKDLKRFYPPEKELTELPKDLEVVHKNGLEKRASFILPFRLRELKYDQKELAGNSSESICAEAKPQKENQIIQKVLKIDGNSNSNVQMNENECEEDKKTHPKIDPYGSLRAKEDEKLTKEEMIGEKKFTYPPIDFFHHLEKKGFEDTILERIERVIESHYLADKAKSLTLEVEFHTGEKIKIALKDLGEKVLVEIKTESEALASFIETNKHHIIRSLEEKNVPTAIQVYPENRETEKRGQKEKKSRYSLAEFVEDFEEKIIGSA